MDMPDSQPPPFYPTYSHYPWHGYYHGMRPPRSNYPHGFTAPIHQEAADNPAYPSPATRSASIQEVLSVDLKPVVNDKKRKAEDEEARETTEVEPKNELSATYIDDPLYLRQQIIGRLFPNTQR
jgi:hypothetical protein